ncbi:MAG: glycosyl transferase, group 1 [Bryobacterales bacterium]|nr:glycosyl transferase, group 1 [Bryobacterales bacterium]
MTNSVVVLTPEPPYPLRGGGAFRVASLLHYFARFADVDLIFLSDSGRPAELPKGLVRQQTVIPLPPSSRSLVARYWRNGRRALRGVPPLVDRVSGLEDRVAEALAGRRYDCGLIEHFWAAGYLPQLAQACGEVILDLHNIESTLHARCAETSGGLVALGHRRFATRSLAMERSLLPGFSLVLTTSEHDRLRANAIAPQATTAVYPNAYPYEERQSTVPTPNTIVFSGNFEYHPNIDGVRFLIREIWPEILRRNSAARLRLVGRGEAFIREAVAGATNVELTGPVDDALAEIGQAAVVIAPLRSGSGTRVKILEAWAAGRAVVATSLAAEGLEIEKGRDIELADDPIAFAETVCRLLRQPSERQKLADGGRHTLQQKYTWEAAWRALDTVPQVTRCKVLRSYTG